MHRKRLILLLCTMVLPLLLLATMQALYNRLFSAITAQEETEEARPADTIIIFGAAIGAGGQPSPVLNSRIMQGLKLYEEGYADYFILTGGIGWEPPAESVVMKRILTARNVPAENIHIETQSTSSIEQVAFAIRTMKEKNWTSALLVSDPLHMYRLKHFFADTDITVFAAPTRSIQISQNRRHMYTQMEILKLLAFRILAPLAASSSASEP